MMDAEHRKRWYQYYTEKRIVHQWLQLHLLKTLGHIHWPKVGGILAGFSRSGAKWLILSVPYQGAQGSVYFYANRHVLHKRNFFKCSKYLKKFRIRDDHDIDAHKWEIGFKDYGLRRLEALVEDQGWVVEKRDFTAGCRSVFLVCRNRDAD